MEEARRTTAYRKDPANEEGLRALNELLEPIQKQLEVQFKSPRLPVVFIIGAPRSGTTSVSQLLAYSGRFAYISNFLARFWLAPLIGAKIEIALGMRGQSLIDPF